MRRAGQQKHLAGDIDVEIIHFFSSFLLFFSPFSPPPSLSSPPPSPPPSLPSLLPFFKKIEMQVDTEQAASIDNRHSPYYTLISSWN